MSIRKNSSENPFERMCTGMCGCLGPQGDVPFCPCRMRHRTVEIVENLRKTLIKNKLEELQNTIRELER